MKKVSEILWMGNGFHLQRIDPFDGQDAFCQTVNLLACVKVIDISFLDLDNHGQHVGSAEHTAVLLVKLDVRVGWGVKLEKVGVNLHPRDRSIGEIYGAKCDQDQHQDIMADMNLDQF